MKVFYKIDGTEYMKTVRDIEEFNRICIAEELDPKNIEIDGNSFLPYFCPIVIPKTYAPTSEDQRRINIASSNFGSNVLLLSNTTKFISANGSATYRIAE